MTNYAEPPAVHHRLKTKVGGVTIYVRGPEIRLQLDQQIIHLSKQDCVNLMEMLYHAADEATEAPNATQHP